MESSPAETAEEEIDRLVEFLGMKSRELMDEEAGENYPRKSKSNSLSRLVTVLKAKKKEFSDKEDVEQVLDELLDWCDEKVQPEDPEYSLEDMSVFIELSKEIRRRLINYEEGLMDVSLKVREEWGKKYG